MILSSRAGVTFSLRGDQGEEKFGSMTKKYKSSAILVSVDQSVGKVLAHDITEIRPGQFKGAAFKKGYIVTAEDIPHLKRLGKEHLYVLNLAQGEVHEDDAALALAREMAGEGVVFDEHPSEGKISLKAARGGLLKVNVDLLTSFNLVPDMCCASRRSNSLVEEEDIVGATRVIPLIIDEKRLGEGIRVLQESSGIFSVRPLAHPDTGVIITGNEVYYKRIEDKFAPLLRKKLEAFGCRLKETVFVPDDKEEIMGGIRKFRRMGVRLILVAGGMSVDPDDVSRLAIAETGATDLVYGTPVLPGAMFLYGRLDGTPILGLPACVLYYRATVLDLMLPRVLAGEVISRRDLAELAHGGLCLHCPECHFPICPFGS
jgi:molybdenum cofactor synthesis domain-containing protein